MEKRKRRPKKVGKPLNRNQYAVNQQQQAQEDLAAFREWVASGEASKPITADELQQMLLLASKIK